MLSRRMRRRLTRHHLRLALLSAVSVVAIYALVGIRGAVHKWSIATGYVAWVLLTATLLIGPLNVIRRRANPVSTDLRRDIGIWAGAISIAHFLLGWQVHMEHRYLYFFWTLKPGKFPTLRDDFFGFANDTGMFAVLIVTLLLALSNDASLRNLGTNQWKTLQRSSYTLAALVVAHTIAYEVIEKRTLPLVILFGVAGATAILFQILGMARSRNGRAKL
jgi:methionine sulfoxide reductase heme-binding subunit